MICEGTEVIDDNPSDRTRLIREIFDNNDALRLQQTSLTAYIRATLFRFRSLDWLDLSVGTAPRPTIFQAPISRPPNSEDVSQEDIVRAATGLKQWGDLLDVKAELVADLWVLDII